MERDIKEAILENEPELVRRAKTDDQAFAVLYNFYFPKIYGYIFKRVGNREVAQDLVSEIFIKVFCHLDEFKFKGYPFRAWVYRIATNRLIDYYRKNAKDRLVALENVSEIASNEPDALQKVENENDAKIVRTILAELPPRYQEVLYLRFFGEMSYEEVAQSFNISVNNARVLTFRALKYFANIFKKYEK